MVESGTILSSSKGIGSHLTPKFYSDTPPTLRGEDKRAYKSWLRRQHLGDTPKNLRRFLGDKKRVILS